jgi:hypothetical protein
MKYIKIWAAAIACSCFVGTSAYALTINDPGVMGTIVTGEPSSIAKEVVYVNTLLAQALGSGPTTIGGHDYTRSLNADPGSGSVSAVGAFQGPVGNTSVPAGYEYVLGKYDGPNGGDVVWYLGGAAINLPADSSTIWVNVSSQGYGLSHYTVFNADAGSVPDGGSTLALMSVGLTALGFLRRKLS